MGPLLEGYRYVQTELPKLKGRATNNMGLAHYINSKGEELARCIMNLIFKILWVIKFQ